MPAVDVCGPSPCALVDQESSSSSEVPSLLFDLFLLQSMKLSAMVRRRRIGKPTEIPTIAADGLVVGQGASQLNSSFTEPSHSLPWQSEEYVQLWVRNVFPEPHETLQLLHEVQAVQDPSTGLQHGRLQLFLSFAEPSQDLPLHSAGNAHVRLREICPVPHETLQALQWFQLVQDPSTGLQHGPVEYPYIKLFPVHALSSQIVFMYMQFRWHTLLAKPQVVLQGLQGPQLLQ